MENLTWREGIEKIISQRETKVFKKDLLNSICRDLDRKNIEYDIFNDNESWTVKLR